MEKSQSIPILKALPFSSKNGQSRMLQWEFVLLTCQEVKMYGQAVGNQSFSLLSS